MKFFEPYLIACHPQILTNEKLEDEHDLIIKPSNKKKKRLHKFMSDSDLEYQVILVAPMTVIKTETQKTSTKEESYEKILVQTFAR